MNAEMNMPSPVLDLGLNGLRFGRPFFAACVLLLASMPPALAASSDCLSDGEVDQTVRIQACTRMIDDGTEPRRNHVIAYFKRGICGTARVARAFLVDFITRERCSHMSGLSARPMTAGLDEVREAGG